MAIPRDKPKARRIEREVAGLDLDYGTGLLPPPAILGVEGKFSGWRRTQESAIMTSLDAETRCVIECLPTGAGKTLIYIAEAVMNGGKVVILTSTKGQQNQIVASIEPMIEKGIAADVRGQMNYRCEAVMAGGEFESENRENAWVPVADGPCQDGAVCSMMERGCGYYDAIRKAKRAKIIIANYAFWMTNGKMQPRWWVTDGKPVDLLVLDEAHEAVNEVCGYLTVEITEEDEKVIKRLLEMNIPAHDTATIETWADWSRRVGRTIENVIEARIDTTGNILDSRSRKKLRRVGSKVDTMSSMSQSNWVVDTPENPPHARNKVIVRFDPIWPLEYAETMLFKGAKKIVMSSATVRMKTAELLGLKDEEVTMFESPSMFDIERRPIYRIPCMQMNYRNENKEGGEEKWIKMIERIAEPRSKWQGIIHTTSYKRRNQLMTPVSSQVRLPRQLTQAMVSHSSSDARTVIENFRSISIGHSSKVIRAKILVSPSVTTGYDFSYDSCRWQVIVKLPFLDTRAKVMKERCKQDKEYGPYHTATTIMQATGRVVRAEDDWGETFIIDDNIVWFKKQYERMFAKWWLEAYVDWGNKMEWSKGQLPQTINFDEREDGGHW